jgi:membrane protease subunit (stomatin/prohibitin family)
VREGQVAAFFNEGKLADMFTAGMYTLDTQTLPILTALLNWDKGFKSPFKSDVYFFSQKEQINLKWGTPQPITVRDKEFGPIRIRAFGGYSFRIEDVAPFQAKITGTLGAVKVAQIEPQLKSAISTAIATAIGGSNIPFLDLAANQQAMSDTLKAGVSETLKQWGLSVQSCFIESLTLPEEVQAYLDKGSSMRVLGNLDQYTKFQTAEAIKEAAGADGGIAGIGAGAAAGMAVGQAMAGGMMPGVGTPAQAAPAAPAAVAPAAPAAPEEDAFAQIEKLHKLMTIGAISQQEFDAKKAELLARVR